MVICCNLFKEEGDELRNTMVMDEDPFTTKLLTFQQEGLEFSPVVATRALLQTLGPSEVRGAIIDGINSNELTFYLCTLPLQSI